VEPDLEKELKEICIRPFCEVKGTEAGMGML